MSDAELWTRFISSFSFTQLGWLFGAFEDNCDNDLISDPDTLATVVEEWLGHQWPAVLQKINQEAFAGALPGHPLPMDFGAFVEFLTQYQELHISEEAHAGFDLENVDSLQDLYDMHNGMTSGDGLKGRALFAVLDDLGIQFHSKEERAWYVEVVTKFDRDGNGFINFCELCQIIRRVVDMEEEKNRRRQFDLIQSSGLPFDEVEDWNRLFISKDEAGRGELQLAEVKALIVGLGVKWDKEVSDRIMDWIADSDNNNNGTIDFGEFCLVISKMWNANLHDIRGAARNLAAKDRTVSLKCVHGTYVAASKEGQITAQRMEAGESETFLMKRLDSGLVCLQSCWGRGFNVTDTEINCGAEGRDQTQFKLTTLEDERIQLTASTPTGGMLFVSNLGEVCISDGNPEDAPFTYFIVVPHDELHKKSWSKTVRMTSKKKPRSLAEGRMSSKERMISPRIEDILSPGMKEAVDHLDSALEAKAMLSARGR